MDKLNINKIEEFLKSQGVDLENNNFKEFLNLENRVLLWGDNKDKFIILKTDDSRFSSGNILYDFNEKGIIYKRLNNYKLKSSAIGKSKLTADDIIKIRDIVETYDIRNNIITKLQ